MTDQRSVFDPGETFYTMARDGSIRYFLVGADGSVNESGETYDQAQVRQRHGEQKLRMIGVEDIGPPRPGTPGSMVLHTKTGEAYLTTLDGKLLRMARMKDAQ